MENAVKFLVKFRCSSFLRKQSSKNAQNFSRQISRRFSRDVLQLQMPNFMAFFILQTFVLDLKPLKPQKKPANQPKQTKQVTKHLTKKNTFLSCLKRTGSVSCNIHLFYCNCCALRTHYKIVISEERSFSKTVQKYFFARPKNTFFKRKGVIVGFRLPLRPLFWWFPPVWLFWAQKLFWPKQIVCTNMLFSPFLTQIVSGNFC